MQVNPDMIDKLEAAGLHFVGKDETGRRMEIVEIPQHPYFVGVQFHPEFKSRPGRPTPVFLGSLLSGFLLPSLFLQTTHLTAFVLDRLYIGCFRWVGCLPRRAKGSLIRTNYQPMQWIHEK